MTISPLGEEPHCPSQFPETMMAIAAEKLLGHPFKAHGYSPCRTSNFPSCPDLSSGPSITEGWPFELVMVIEGGGTW